MTVLLITTVQKGSYELFYMILKAEQLTCAHNVDKGWRNANISLRCVSSTIANVAQMLFEKELPKKQIHLR